jgi:mycothiol synthase
MTGIDTTPATAGLPLEDAPDLPGLRFRRPRPDDDAEFEPIAAVMAAANLKDRIAFVPTAEHLRDDLARSAGTDLVSDVILAELDGRLVAWGSVQRVIRAGDVVYESWGVVHPDVRRRGLGTAILHENLRRVRERVAAAGPADAGAVVQTMVDETEIGHRALVEAAGFAPIRWFFLMHRPDLDDVPDAPLPDGLEVRPVDPADVRRILAAEEEAFQDHWGWREQTQEDVEIILGRRELDTDLWIVAWDGDEVAGVVQNWIWPDENATLGVKRGWLEHISVRRPWRRRGLGRALTAASLRRIREAGMADAMLGVDADNPTGALALYQGLGFVVHQRSTCYRGAVTR